MAHGNARIRSHDAFRITQSGLGDEAVEQVPGSFPIGPVTAVSRFLVGKWIYEKKVGKSAEFPESQATNRHLSRACSKSLYKCCVVLPVYQRGAIIQMVHSCQTFVGCLACGRRQKENHMDHGWVSTLCLGPPLCEADAASDRWGKHPD